MSGDTSVIFPSVDVPQSFIDFAKATANLASAHGIKRFQMRLDPSYANVLGHVSNHGVMEIVFADVDGRGRPCRNLKIQVTTTLSHSIEKNPESYS